MDTSSENAGEGGGPPSRSGSAAGAQFLGVIQAVLAIFAAFLVAAAIVSPVSESLVSAGVLEGGSLGLNVVQTVLQFVGFVVAIAGYLTLTDQWGIIYVDRPTARHLAAAGVAVLLLLAAQFGAGLLLTSLGVSFGENQVITTGREAPVYFLYMIPVSLLLVGPIEELLFRGVAQGVLRRPFGSRGAIVIASGLFGLVHWVAVSGGPTQKLAYVAVAAALGIVLGSLYERTETLLAPALAHGVYNSVLFGIQYAGAVGGL